MKACTILLLFAYPVWAIISPLIASNGDTDLDSLRAHVLQLEQTVSNLQTQSQTQEQKYAAVLQSVLSKLTSTTDELTTLKIEHNATREELGIVRALLMSTDKNYTIQCSNNVNNNIKTQLTELESVKTELNTTRKELVSLRALIMSTDENCTESNSTIKNLEKNMVQMNTEIVDLKSDLSRYESNMTSIVSNVKSLNSTVEFANHHILSIKSNRNSTERQLDTVRSQIKALAGTNVSFEVRLKEMVNASVHFEAIRFDHIVQNIGGGYQIDSGKFRTPTSGTYMFWSHVMVLGNTGLHMILNKNAVIEVRGYTPQTLPKGVASLTTVLHLKQGDEVFVGKAGAVVNGEGFSSFGGVLIHPDFDFLV